MSRYKFYRSLNVAAMSYTSLLQCSVWEPEDRKWYLSQARNAGPRDLEHNIIRRFNEKGGYEGFCKLERWGHGSHIGVRKSAAGNVWVWSPLDSYNSKGTTIRERASRVIFDKGKTKDKKSGGVDIFSSNLGSGAFGHRSGRMYLRQGHGSYETYRLVDEEDFRNGKAKVLDTVKVTKHGRNGPFQGCNARDDNMFVLSGSTNKTNLIQCYSWKTNKNTHNIQVKMSELRAALKGHVTTLSSVEPEGLQFIGDTLYMGMRTGPAGNRRDFAILSVDY